MLRANLGVFALEAEWQLISILDRKCSAQCQQIMSFYSDVSSTWRKWYIVSIWITSKPHTARCISVFWNKMHGLPFIYLSASPCNAVHAWTRKLFLVKYGQTEFPDSIAGAWLHIPSLGKKICNIKFTSCLKSKMCLIKSKVVAGKLSVGFFWLFFLFF